MGSWFSCAGFAPSAAEMEEYKEIVKGKFDEHEIAYMYRLYYSAAPSGAMGRAEFKRYIESLHIFKRVDQQEQYDQLFRGYDRDGSHTISFKEYLLYHLGIVFSTEELFDIIFAMYDVDGGGFITKEGMRKVITNSTRWMGYCDVESKEVETVISSTIDKIIAVADADKDGRLSKEELFRATKKHPDILDKLKNLA